MAKPEAFPDIPKSFSCLILEDDPGFAALVTRLVQGLGGEVRHCATLAEAQREWASRCFDLLLLDNHLPDGKVYDFFDTLRRRQPEAPALMITGASDLTEAITLTRNGLFDYLTKPVDLQALEASLRRALLRISRHDPPGQATAGSLGRSAAIRAVETGLKQAARHPEAVVLLLGESGVGKDLAVRTLHQWTHGAAVASRPYVPLNCAAVPADMFEAELFGAERGAYTGADKKRPGLVAAAHGGTLFLDEIGEIPLPQQAKLLRFLEDREFRPLGSTETRRFAGRVVAATNRDLSAEVAAGRFRGDLLFRLEVLTLAIPPLRQRAEDIPLLAEQLLSELALKYGVTAPWIRPEDLQALSAYAFPGNVRELRNILERSLLRTLPNSPWLEIDRAWLGARGSVLPAAPAAPAAPVSDPATSRAGGLADWSASLPPERASLTALEAQEYRLIRSTLAECRGGIRRTAAKLGFSPQALLRRLEKWPELRPPADPS